MCRASSPPPPTSPEGEGGRVTDCWNVGEFCRGSGYKLTQPTCGERTHFSRQTGGGRGVLNKIFGYFKGTVRSKNKSMQKDKNDTQHLRHFE
jgi:hypothetical protein